MKRKLYCALICCVILFSLVIPAYADGVQEYILDDIGMTVSIPSDHIVFLRDTDLNDAELSAYGLTKDSLSSFMNERGIYLYGWDAEAGQEIIIAMMDSPLDDFNLYSDTTLLMMAETFKAGFESADISMTDTEIYQQAQTKFLKMNISWESEGSTVYGLQYNTAYAGKVINITMQSYSGQITAQQEAVIKSIVDSAEFDTAPQTIKTNSSPTDAFTYTDTETKATFIVPANWVETPLTGERETINAKFTSLEEDGMGILYGGFDLWNEMTEAERGALNRSDIDNSYLSKAYIAEIFGVTSDEIEIATYGENEYYTMAVTSDTDAYGLSFDVTITHMICVENGYMHWFQFSGGKGDKLYDDFTSLLASASFPSPTSAGYPEKSSAPSSRFDLIIILLDLIATITVYSLPIIIYRYAVKKEPVEKNKAKKITIIYGICACAAMFFIAYAINGSGTTGGAIFLWSWVNYRVLIGGKTKPAAAADVDGAALAENISETGQTDNSAQVDE